jgi:hypothetical protein
MSSPVPRPLRLSSPKLRSTPVNHHLDCLQRKIRILDETIQDLEKRIPPHSVKASFILELESLEEKRDAIAAEIMKIESQRQHRK